jgi:hypothetical protein
MKNSSEEKFNREDYVFFKMKGYPWWPGYITDIEKSNKKQIYTIADPFTNTLSKINDIKSIIKFEENIESIASKAKGKKYINSIIASIETYFEGRKIPEKFNKIIKDLKNGNSFDKNITNKNINNVKDKNDINDSSCRNNEEKHDKNENKNEYLLNKKRKPLKDENINNKKETKIKKLEPNQNISELKEPKDPKTSPNKENDLNKKKKKPKLEGLEKIKEDLKEKERREQEKLKEQREKELKEKEKEEKNDQKKIIKNSKELTDKYSDSEEMEEPSISSSSELKENNIMIKNYKNLDFYQIVKYLKRIAQYLDKNQKEGKESHFTIEDKKNFIKVMEYLNKKEMNDTIQFLKTTNIGNYINYIHEKTKIKEFKDLTKKFLVLNYKKIEMQLLVQNIVDINDINI